MVLIAIVSFCAGFMLCEYLDRSISNNNKIIDTLNKQIIETNRRYERSIMTYAIFKYAIKNDMEINIDEICSIADAKIKEMEIDSLISDAINID